MTLSQHHIIRKQVLEVQVSEETGAFALQRELGRLLREEIAEKLQPILSGLVPRHHYLQLDQLEVNLGNIDPFKAPRHFVEKVVQGIEKGVKEKMGRAEISTTPGQTAHPQFLSEKTAVQKQWLHFLETGLLPWWATPVSENKIIEILKEPDALFPQQLKKMFASQPKTVRRLLGQYPLPIVTAVVASLAGKEKDKVAYYFYLFEIMLKKYPTLFKKYFCPTTIQHLAKIPLVDVGELLLQQIKSIAPFLSVDQLIRGVLEIPKNKINPAKKSTLLMVIKKIKKTSANRKSGQEGTFLEIKKINFNKNNDSRFASDQLKLGTVLFLLFKKMDWIKDPSMPVQKRLKKIVQLVGYFFIELNVPEKNQINIHETIQQLLIESTKNKPVRLTALQTFFVQELRAVTTPVSQPVFSQLIQAAPSEIISSGLKNTMLQKLETLTAIEIQSAEGKRRTVEKQSIQEVKSTKEKQAKRKALARREEAKKILKVQGAGETKKQQQKRQFQPRVHNPSEKNNKLKTLIEEGVFIHNAGLLMLAPLLPSFFEKTGLVKNKSFVDEAAPERGVHLLQYLATGSEATPEHELIFNKILCGIPLDTPLEQHVLLTETEKTNARDLLQYVISEWKALKNSSAATLQQLFLQREGKLVHNDPNWTLRVEEHAMDILLGKLPWGFSVVKLSWMEEMVFGEWG